LPAPHSGRTDNLNRACRENGFHWKPLGWMGAVVKTRLLWLKKSLETLHKGES